MSLFRRSFTPYPHSTHKHRPCIIADGDEDDNELIRDKWRELDYANTLLFFRNGHQVLEHLHGGPTVPFLILGDVNIPRMEGFDLKKKLLEEPSLNYKSIPFIFWSSQASLEQLKKAYDLAAHGFSSRAAPTANQKKKSSR